MARLSWLRDPDTGGLATPLNDDEIKKLKYLVGRQPQRKGWHWVVQRNEQGDPIGMELRPVPKHERGLGI